jgi:hypothetical protein
VFFLVEVEVFILECLEVEVFVLIDESSLLYVVLYIIVYI